MKLKRYEWVACDEHACHCDVIESAEGDMVDYEDYAALEARCAALAAENAGLKSFISQSCYSYDGDGSDVCDSYVNAEESQMFPKTPATDAFLAEVRAQGVEMMVEQCESDIMLIEPEDEEFYTLMIEHAKDFASELRKGVQP